MIREKLNEDMKTALKGGDKMRLSVVRMLISELKNERIAQGADLDEGAERKVLASYAKRRKEAIEAARAGGREDVATKEQAGAVMKSVMAELGGQADGKLVSALVRELLG